MKKTIAGGLMAAVLLFGSVACAGQEHEDKRGRGDAPVAGAKGDDSKAFCTNMPDEYGNVCGKCIAHFPPWAVVVTTHYQTSSNIGIFQAPKQCGGKTVPGPLAVVGAGPGKAPEDDS